MLALPWNMLIPILSNLNLNTKNSGIAKKMKEQRTKVRRAKKQPSEEKQHRNLPQMTVGWGRAGSAYRPGLFTKRYFEKHGEVCAADIFRALGDEIRGMNQERIEIGEKPFRRPNYSSFSRYFHWFLIMGLIERTDKREPAIYNFLQKRVFYRLTEKGKTEWRAWEDPVRAAHPEFG